MALEETVPASRELYKVLTEDFAPYWSRLQQNLDRNSKLVSAARHFLFTDELSDVAEDVLRAAVVLTHAYLEDFLRTIGVAILPNRDESGLSGIPLVGFVRRPDSFSLGQLAKLRGKTVEEVLRDSVARYLDNSSFNSTDEIALLLEKLGFKVKDHNEQFSTLQEMILRRHQIVHRADRVKVADPDTYRLQPLHPEQVEEWLSATANFMAGLISQLFDKLERPKSPLPASL